MKIGFFVVKFPVPSETFVLNQMIYFLNQGYEVEVVSIFPGDLKNLHQSYNDYDLVNKTRYLLPSEKDSKHSKLLDRVKSVLKSITQSRVRKSLSISKYGQHAKNLLLPAILSANKDTISADIFLVHFGFSGVLANKLRELNFLHGKIATVFHGADVSTKEILQLYKEDYQTLFKQGDLMLPISYLWKEKLISLGCNADKIHVVRMGINPENFKFTLRSEIHSPIRLLTVARMEEKKGIDIAIKACSELKKSGIDFTYNIIGSGSLEVAIKEQIKMLNLESEIKTLGFKDQEEVASFLNESDIFLLPSITAEDGDMEGIPVALMEAMAVGIPVISTFHSGIPELITNNVSGWLTTERNHQEIADCIKAIVNAPEKISEIVLNARQVTENQFNQDNSYKLLSQILAHAVAKN